MSGSQIQIFPGGAADALTFLPDYGSLEAKHGRCHKKESFSRRLKDNKFRKLRASGPRKALPRTNLVTLSAYFNDQQDSTPEESSEVIHVPVGHNDAIIYEEPNISFADIKPFIGNYTDALVSAYDAVSKAEGEIHETKLLDLIQGYEKELKVLIAKQQVYIDKQRVRVERMLAKHDGTRQLLKRLNESRRMIVTLQENEITLLDDVTEADRLLLKVSGAGVAAEKLKLKAKTTQVLKNAKKVRGELDNIKKTLPALRSELEGAQLKSENLDAKLVRLENDIEDTNVEIKVESELSKKGTEIPESVRVEVRDIIFGLHNFSSYFSSLAAGIEYSLQCSMCQTRLKEPRQVWPCGHVFCFECVKKSSGNKSSITTFRALRRAIRASRALFETTLEDFAAHDTDSPLNKVDQLEFEIALRRVDVMLSTKQSKILWGMVDPTGENSASVGTIVALLTAGKVTKSSALAAILHVKRNGQPSLRSSQKLSMIAAKAKFAAAAKAMEKAISLCPNCKVEPGVRSKTKYDRLRDKVLYRLGFFENQHQGKLDVLKLCQNLSLSLDEIQALVR